MRTKGNRENNEHACEMTNKGEPIVKTINSVQCENMELPLAPTVGCNLL